MIFNKQKGVDLTKNHFLFRFETSTPKQNSLVLGQAFASDSSEIETGENLKLGRLIGYQVNIENKTPDSKSPIFIYEGQVLKKSPHGFGRLIFFQGKISQESVRSLVGEFDEGSPSGKVVKFIRSPFNS